MPKTNFQKQIRVNEPVSVFLSFYDYVQINRNIKIQKDHEASKGKGVENFSNLATLGQYATSKNLYKKSL